MKLLYLACLVACISWKCNTQTISTSARNILPGAYQIVEYLPRMEDKRVGLVINQTSVIAKVHLLDTLISLGISVSKVFTPEHGFRGIADAGQKIENSTMGEVSIISLYGKNKKPSPEDLSDIDVMVFDMQDVGVRFYTYISTLHYVMEACAENDVPLIVLDRPNPNGHYVDGPLLEKEFSSFVGMHPVPIVYGMTIGEYAQMINGEKWLKGGVQAQLYVVRNKNYDRNMIYDLPIKPSPNLPNLRSVLLYPSLCLFEGTTVSVGRGTDRQFQLIGHPNLGIKYLFHFTPESRSGAKYPKHEGIQCYGVDLSFQRVDSIRAKRELNFTYLLSIFEELNSADEPFFLENNFFDKLAGSDVLRKQILSNTPWSEIQESWQPGLKQFKTIREKYLLYD